MADRTAVRGPLNEALVLEFAGWVLDHLAVSTVPRQQANAGSRVGPWPEGRSCLIKSRLFSPTRQSSLPHEACRIESLLPGVIERLGLGLLQMSRGKRQACLRETNRMGQQGEPEF